METPCPFSPGTSPEPTSPVIPAASPEAPHPMGQASPSQSVVTSNAGSFSSRMGSVPDLESPTTRPADPSRLTSHCSSPCPPDHTWIAEHSDLSTQSVKRSFTSSTVTADSAESAASGAALPLRLDSTSATTRDSASEGAPADLSGPVCDAGHVPDQDLLMSLETLAQRGDEAHLPQYLHQVTSNVSVRHETPITCSA